MAEKSERVVAQASEVVPVSSMYRREAINIALFGLGVGILFAAAYYLLEQYVFGSILCRAGNDTACSSAPNYAMAVAMVLSTVVGVVGLVQLRSYRPLIVVLAVAVSFWGLDIILANVPWIVGIAASALLFAFGYALFSWIVRLRSATLAAIIALVLVILIRLALVS